MAKSFRSRARRRVGWSDGPSTSQQFTATSLLIWSVGAQANSDGLTIVRIRGEMLMWLSSVAALTDVMTGAFGICIVNENAFGAGSASIMSPFDDAEWDGWMYHKFFHLGALADGSSGAGVFRDSIDSKAMRKIKETDVLVGITHVGSESGTVVMNTAVDSRVLIKLP